MKTPEQGLAGKVLSCLRVQQIAEMSDEERLTQVMALIETARARQVAGMLPYREEQETAGDGWRWEQLNELIRRVEAHKKLPHSEQRS